MYRKAKGKKSEYRTNQCLEDELGKRKRTIRI